MQQPVLVRERSYPIGVTAGPPNVDPHVKADGPTQARKRLRESRDQNLPHGLGFVARHKHADAPHPGALLRPCRERPCRRRATESSDELAPSKKNAHQIEMVFPTL